MTLAAGLMFRPTDVVALPPLTERAVFVVEQLNHRVSKWNYTSGGYTFTKDATWGSNGDGTTGEPGPIGDGGVTDTFFHTPTGIAYDPDNSQLLVTDTFHNRVRTINVSTGAFVASIGTPGTGNDNFFHPTGIEVNSADNFLFVCDEGNHRAVRYATGVPPTFDSVLPSPTIPFIQPHGVSYFINNNEVVVSDSQRGLLSFYNSLGTTFNDQLGTPSSSKTDDDALYFPGSGKTDVTPFKFMNTKSGTLKTITGTGNAVLNNTLVSEGQKLGQFNLANACASWDDTVNYILVANTKNNRIEVFDQSDPPEIQGTFGEPSTIPT